MKVTVSSTGWHGVNLLAVSNFKDDIKIGKRNYNKSETCYTRRIEFAATSNSWQKFYALAKHIENDCGGNCTYCKKQYD